VSVYLKTGAGATAWSLVSTTPTTNPFFDTIISATLAGTTVNDWAPGTLGQNTLVRATITAGAELSGISGGRNGMTVTIINLGTLTTSPSFKLLNAQGSMAGNQLLICDPPGPDVIDAQVAVTLYYDGASAAWRTINAAL
jgi:hypothetical protein